MSKKQFFFRVFITVLALSGLAPIWASSGIELDRESQSIELDGQSQEVNQEKGHRAIIQSLDRRYKAVLESEYEVLCEKEKRLFSSSPSLATQIACTGFTMFSAGFVFWLKNRRSRIRGSLLAGMSAIDLFLAGISAIDLFLVAKEIIKRRSVSKEKSELKSKLRTKCPRSKMSKETFRKIFNYYDGLLSEYEVLCEKEKRLFSSSSSLATQIACTGFTMFGAASIFLLGSRWSRIGGSLLTGMSAIDLFLVAKEIIKRRSISKEKSELKSKLSRKALLRCAGLPDTTTEIVGEYTEGSGWEELIEDFWDDQDRAIRLSLDPIFCINGIISGSVFKGLNAIILHL